MVGSMAAVLDTVFEGVLIATAVRDGTGTIRDFRIDFANRAARDADGRSLAAAVGDTMLATYPALAESLLFEDWVQVTETGEPVVRLALSREAVRPGGLQVADVAISRMGDGFVQAWREATAAQELAGELADSRRRLEEAQRMARLGSWEFDMATSQLRWSDELFRIMGLDPRGGPLGFEDSLEAIVPGDRDKILVATARAFRDREPFTFEQRIVRTDGSERLIRTHGEAVEHGGAVVGIRGTTQDVTDQRIAEADHHIAQTLQHSVVAERLPPRAGLGLAARYLPATDVAGVGVGGDWYDVFDIAGATFLVVGDVAGHGVAAATTMVQLRNAVRAFALSSEGRPGQVLALLNRFVIELLPDATATIVCARYEPASRAITWAHAGHPPPLLCGSSGIEYLSPPAGVLLGAVVHAGYDEQALELAPGDRLLLFSDGLVERRGASFTDGLTDLRQLVRDTGPVGLEDLCDRLTGELPKAVGREDDTCLLVAESLPG